MVMTSGFDPGSLGSNPNRLAKRVNGKHYNKTTGAGYVATNEVDGDYKK